MPTRPKAQKTSGSVIVVVPAATALLVPRPVARIVAALLGDFAQAVLAGVEEDVAVQHRRAQSRFDQPIGELGALGRRRAVDRHLRIMDSARLTEGSVIEPDIDVEDRVAVLKDSEQVGESAIVLEDFRILAAEFGRRGDQRAEGGEVVLDVANGFAAEAFDQVRRVVARDAIARDIVGPHDPEQNRHSHCHEDHEHRRLERYREPPPQRPASLAGGQVARRVGQSVSGLHASSLRETASVVGAHLRAAAGVASGREEI